MIWNNRSRGQSLHIEKRFIWSKIGTRTWNKIRELTRTEFWKVHQWTWYLCQKVIIQTYIVDVSLCWWPPSNWLWWNENGQVQVKNEGGIWNVIFGSAIISEWDWVLFVTKLKEKKQGKERKTIEQKIELLSQVKSYRPHHFGEEEDPLEENRDEGAQWDRVCHNKFPFLNLRELLRCSHEIDFFKKVNFNLNVWFIFKLLITD